MAVVLAHLRQNPPHAPPGALDRLHHLFMMTSDVVHDRVLVLQRSMRRLDAKLHRGGLSLLQVASVIGIGCVLGYGMWGGQVKEGLSREGADVVGQVVSSKELQAKLEKNATALVAFLTHDPATHVQLQELAMTLLASDAVQNAVASLVLHLISQPWAVASTKQLALNVVEQLRDDPTALDAATAFFSSVFRRQDLQQAAGEGIRASITHAAAPLALDLHNDHGQVRWMCTAGVLAPFVCAPPW
ncbi:uncharacterized protein AMSG_02582 [Thecamonas trahens ATCC 50062]|uniref:Uncharacterized protein n=1 Tax=Thecamonas trahens ATCC 50062 TaxID=461836 RepID=A0A0L0D5A1_THETB|nr:hypothetical protein AMSG_02582 [Thecamonas trahens ATCC 50062]KNC47557.1 hypothetical protein AMSG_02582 [Thecamonas trahens ATCC 50062]|eukprot:XP_013759489.1 hypothetical protein AMSG_02582 [Thecamonas trahens ATCC 50062]